MIIAIVLAILSVLIPLALVIIGIVYVRHPCEVQAFWLTFLPSDLPDKLQRWVSPGALSKRLVQALGVALIVGGLIALWEGVKLVVSLPSLL